MQRPFDVKSAKKLFSLLILPLTLLFYEDSLQTKCKLNKLWLPPSSPASSFWVQMLQANGCSPLMSHWSFSRLNHEKKCHKFTRYQLSIVISLIALVIPILSPVHFNSGPCRTTTGCRFYLLGLSNQGTSQNQPNTGTGKTHKTLHQPLLPMSCSLLTVADKVGIAIIGRNNKTARPTCGSK